MAGRGAGVAAALPGLAFCAAGGLLAWAVNLLLPAIPLLTIAVAIGVIVAQIRPARPALDGVLAPGLAISSRRLLRLSIVLLGLDLALGDLAVIGWWGLLAVVLATSVAFAGTYLLARALRLPGDEPLLLATGFSICGISAIGAVAGARGSSRQDQAVPMALVTLCGTLAIAVLPAIALPLGFSPQEFGRWAGASVHDVGQVVATAQIGGATALAVAVIVKLTRVLLLAPLAAGVAILSRRSQPGAGAGRRPPIVPLFVAGFVAAILVRTFVPLPPPVVIAADQLRTALMAMALVALGSAIRAESLVRSGPRAALAGLASWALIALVTLPIAFLPAAA